MTKQILVYTRTSNALNHCVSDKEQTVKYILENFTIRCERHKEDLSVDEEPPSYLYLDPSVGTTYHEALYKRQETVIKPESNGLENKITHEILKQNDIILCKMFDVELSEDKTEDLLNTGMIKTYTGTETESTYDDVTGGRWGSHSRDCQENFLSLLNKNISEEESSNYLGKKYFISLYQNQIAKELEFDFNALIDSEALKSLANLNWNSGLIYAIRPSFLQQKADEHFNLTFLKEESVTIAKPIAINTKIETNAGETLYSEIIPEILSSIPNLKESIIDLSDIELAFTEKLAYGKKDSSLESDVTAKKYRKRGQDLLVKISNNKGSSFCVDEIGTIGFVGELQENILQQITYRFNQHFNNKRKISVILPKSLYSRKSNEEEHQEDDLANYFEICELTKASIIRRSAFFPVLINTKGYVSEEGVEENIKIICLFNFASLFKVLKFNRSRTLTAHLLDAITNKDYKGLKFLNFEEYKKEKYKHLLPFLQNSEKIAEFYQSTVDMNWGIVEDKSYSLPSMKKLALNKALSREIKISPTLKKEWEDISSQNSKIKEQEHRKKATIRTSTYDITEFKKTINDLTAQIELTKENMHRASLEDERLKKELADINELSTILNEEYLLKKKEYEEEYTKKLLNNEYEQNNFFLNLEKTGIQVTDVKVQDNESGDDKKNNIFWLTTIIQEKKYIDPQEFEKYKILEVLFSYTKPVTINVNSLEGKNKIIAGPYNIKVCGNSISLQLKDFRSLFGWKREEQGGCIKVKTHPHTGAFNLNTKENYKGFLTQWRDGCLGEISSILFNAFKRNNLKEILIATNSWITSAYSSDQWGREWTWFIKENHLNKNITEEAINIELAIDEVNELLTETNNQEEASSTRDLHDETYEYEVNELQNQLTETQEDQETNTTYQETATTYNPYRLRTGNVN